MGAVTVREAGAPHRRHPIEAQEDVGALRRAVRVQVGRTAPELSEGEAELAATELATNLLRHATGGYVLTRPVDGGIELISVDRGPGLPAGVLVEAGAVGPSAAAPPRRGGLGVGLASVRRHATLFDWYSDSDGTVILARLQAHAPETTARMVWGGVNVPLGGDGESGDAWAVAAGGRVAAIVADGLGHGAEAAAASRAAVGVFDRVTLAGDGGTWHAETGLGEYTAEAHSAMRATRGGVLGVCVIDVDAEQAVYAGIGNITGLIAGGLRGTYHLISHPGTLGTQLAAPRARTAVHPWAPGAVLVLASDGIDTRWNPSARPGLLNRHPSVVAATIHRDHARGTDDAAVLIVRDHRSREPEGDER
jgi:anti-sigma regulatory factor (Ser/Thr protein kinase)